VTSVILFIVFVFLMALNAIKSDPAIHSIFFVVLLVICIAGSIALDLSLFQLKRNQSPDDAQIRKPAYHPNLHIWAVGMLSGIAATIVYLITVVTLSLVRVTAVTEQTLYQYAMLLSVLTIGIVFTIWGIVQVCRE
jgi:hypothetical protein